MHRFIRQPLIAALLSLGLAAAGRAQSEPAKPAATEPTPFTNAKQAAANADGIEAPRPAKPKRERMMSDDLAATLAVGMPKYSPPKPPEKKVDTPEDERETDKPKNGIVRLPEYVVRETRSPVFRDRDLNTTEGKADVAMKRYAGLNFGPFASLNRPIALAMYQEQERLDNMAELSDDAKTAKRSGDQALADYITRQSQQTYMRGNSQAPTYGISK